MPPEFERQEDLHNLDADLGAPLGDPRRPGHHFSERFKMDIDNRNASIVSRDPEVINRHRMTMDEWFSVYDAGFEVATVVNLHPRDLEHNFGFMGILRVPGRKSGQIFYRHVVDQPRVDQRDLGDAKFSAKAYLPFQLAKDFCKQFAEMGGVFCYIGDRQPSKEEVAEATEKMIVWYRKIYRAAQNQWAKKPAPAMIDDHMRSAARTLFELQEIEVLPPWVEKTRAESRKKWQTCPQCGKDDVPLTAKICTICQYVFDEAFYTSRGFTVSGGIIVARPGQASPIMSSPIPPTPPSDIAKGLDGAAKDAEGDDFSFKKDDASDLADLADIRKVASAADPLIGLKKKMEKEKK